METVQLGTISITYFGKSAFLLESGGQSVYFDPVDIPDSISAEKKADLILVSHADAYNVQSKDVEKLLSQNTRLFGPQKVEDTIGPDVQVIAEGDEYDHLGVQFAVVPAYNEGSSFHPRDFGYGYEVVLGDMKIYYAGDTDLIPGMSDRKDIDVAFLPIEGKTTMDYRDAVEAVKMIQPTYAIPMHYVADIDSPADNFKLAAGAYTTVLVLHGANEKK